MLEIRRGLELDRTGGGVDLEQGGIRPGERIGQGRAGIRIGCGGGVDRACAVFGDARRRARSQRRTFIAFVTLMATSCDVVFTPSEAMTLTS